MAIVDPDHNEQPSAGVNNEAEAEAKAAGAEEEEDTGADLAPIVQLQKVAVITGEEDEDVILDLKAKLYRFDKDGDRWKERGDGVIKFLKHKNTRKVRLLMRRFKTLKICANHYVYSTMTVKEHAGNEMSCVWRASDFADGELKDEYFCIRLTSVDNCKKFMETFQETAESQNSRKENIDVSEAAAFLDYLCTNDEGQSN